MGSKRIAVGVFVLATILGLGVFGLMAWRSVSVERTDTTGAKHNFEEARASVRSAVPLVRRDADGRFVRGPAVESVGPPATQLHVLAYYADGTRLVRADVPLWFFTVKGPAVSYALRDTGFDLETLGLTASDLKQAGSRLVLDEQRATGDRLMAWTN